jgi:colanic acid biosynthesis glycosyl transferase WcaI
VPRLLIASQVFPPSHDAISQLLEDLVRGLAETGCEVHALTPAANYMTGEPLPRHEMRQGVRVWRVPIPRGDKGNLARRSLSYGAFLALSAPALRLIPKPDAVFYLSTPPWLAWGARFAGAPSALLAQDVYPEILKSSGHVKSRLAFAALKAFDRAVLSGVDRVVVLGERMREAMERKGVPREKIALIENWAPAAGIGEGRREGNPLLARLGLEDKLVVQYSGNMGVVHDMAPIADAAEILRADAGVAFLLIGGGARRAEMERRKAEAGLDNMVLLPYQPREELGTSLAAADVSLVSLRPEMEGLIVPSKLYGALAAGRPVVNIGDPDGEVARVIRRAACGVTVRTGAELADAIAGLERDGAGRRAMGERARGYFLAHCGRERSVAKYRRLVEELTGR